MRVTTRGPIQPTIPLDGIGGTSRDGSDASSRRGAGSVASVVGSVASAAGSVLSSIASASAVGAVPVTGTS